MRNTGRAIAPNRYGGPGNNCRHGPPLKQVCARCLELVQKRDEPATLHGVGPKVPMTGADVIAIMKQDLYPASEAEVTMTPLPLAAVLRVLEMVGVLTPVEQEAPSKIVS